MIRRLVFLLPGFIGLMVSAGITDGLKPVHPEDTTSYFDYAYLREINTDSLHSRYPWLYDVVRKGIRDFESNGWLRPDSNFFHLSILKQADAPDIIEKVKASKRDCIKRIFPRWTWISTGISNRQSSETEDVVAIFTANRYALPSDVYDFSKSFLRSYYSPKEYGSLVYININDTIVYIKENELISDIPSTGNSRKEFISDDAASWNRKQQIAIYSEIKQTTNNYRIKDRGFFVLAEDLVATVNKFINK